MKTNTNNIKNQIQNKTDNHNIIKQMNWIFQIMLMKDQETVSYISYKRKLG